SEGSCGGECPLWVIGTHSARQLLCPLYPQKRTLSRSKRRLRAVTFIRSRAGPIPPGGGLAVYYHCSRLLRLRFFSTQIDFWDFIWSGQKFSTIEPPMLRGLRGQPRAGNDRLQGALKLGIQRS